MADVIKLKKGLDLRLEGVAQQEFGQASQGEFVGFNPSDFYGIVPKPALKPGDAVKVGTVLPSGHEVTEITPEKVTLFLDGLEYSIPVVIRSQTDINDNE